MVGFDTGAAFHQAAPSHQSLSVLPTETNADATREGARRLESGEAAAMTSISSENRAQMASRRGGKQRRTSGRLIWGATTQALRQQRRVSVGFGVTVWWEIQEGCGKRA